MGIKVNQELYNSMCEIVGSDNVYIDEPMMKHTTFRVGGNADYFINPHTNKEIRDIVRLCRKSEIEYYILGNGSNLLVSDEGYRGVVIQIYKNMSLIKIENNTVYAQAGVLLSKLAKKACESGLKGIEFASGIPGTLGGAVTMNAGAYGGEMQDIVRLVTVMKQTGEIIELKKKDMQFGYRTSTIMENEYIVLEVEIELEAGSISEIMARCGELKRSRLEKQPLEYASAGSTFKRPEGYFAGKLIMDAGLRGYSIGDAQVSEKHCGFIINKGNATAAEIYELIQSVRQRVYEKFGVNLEAEVKMLGSFGK